MSTLKALSALLTYPEAELQAALPEIGAVLAVDRRLPAPQRDAMARLITMMKGSALMDLQERYVALFDRSPSLSLHLFEHVHGVSRDRGMAMVRLVEMYKAHGLAIEARELPDYLPLFLEFLSLLPEAEARSLLAEAGAVLAGIAQRLARRASPYTAVFEALCALGGSEAPIAKDETPEAGEDLAALDKAWEEAAVTFGPTAQAENGSGCDRVAAMVQRMNAPKQGVPS
jgi:nitrate reductase delta subunit